MYIAIRFKSNRFRTSLVFGSTLSARPCRLDLVGSTLSARPCRLDLVGSTLSDDFRCSPADFDASGNSWMGQCRVAQSITFIPVTGEGVFVAMKQTVTT